MIQAYPHDCFLVMLSIWYRSTLLCHIVVAQSSI